MTESVSILEEALCIKSVLSDDFTEVLNYCLAKVSLSRVSLASSIDGLNAHVTNGNINVLLETLLSEHLIHFV